MSTVVRTSVFDRWLSRLKDPLGKANIIKRVRSAERGNFGDCAPVGEGVMEMRIHSGPGYRVYYMRISETMVALLCGGTKHRQSRDIEKARQLKEI